MLQIGQGAEEALLAIGIKPITARGIILEVLGMKDYGDQIYLKRLNH